MKNTINTNIGGKNSHFGSRNLKTQSLVVLSYWDTQPQKEQAVNFNFVQYILSTLGKFFFFLWLCLVLL